MLLNSTMVYHQFSYKNHVSISSFMDFVYNVLAARYKCLREKNTMLKCQPEDTNTDMTKLIGSACSVTVC